MLKWIFPLHFEFLNLLNLYRRKRIGFGLPTNPLNLSQTIPHARDSVL